LWARSNPDGSFPIAEQNGVAGTLPFELNRLQNLRQLILEEGILTGTIPSELGMVRTLQQIDLNFNLLQGPIPEELYDLSNLQQMDLNDNELTGTISPSIGKLAKLSFFQIENNQFTGTVPTEIGELNALGTSQIMADSWCVELVLSSTFSRTAYFLDRSGFDSFCIPTRLLSPCRIRLLARPLPPLPTLSLLHAPMHRSPYTPLPSLTHARTYGLISIHHRQYTIVHSYSNNARPKRGRHVGQQPIEWNHAVQ
jgi:hypothetical protein